MPRRGPSSSGKGAWLLALVEKKWGKRFAVLKGSTFQLFTSQKDTEPKRTIDLSGKHVAFTKTRKKNSFAIGSGGKAKLLTLAADSPDEADAWLSLLLMACVPRRWPGGEGINSKPQPLLSSRISLAERKNEEGVFAPLPPLKSVEVYQRRALFLRKLRLCSVVYDVVDGFHDERSLKRETLLEIVDYCSQSKGGFFRSFRCLEDAVTMVRLNIFRPLEKTRRPSDELMEEERIEDPRWPILCVVYEFLLQIVSFDVVELAMKKRVIDPSFIQQLIPLFDSQDAAEREVLKTIVHRTYSKLTQRRSLIRRWICNTFYEFVYETDEHNGIAEMLEILASIINGFAKPIKKDHKQMLHRALIPLHKSRLLGAFHSQLAYCMALFVAKEHQLTQPIILALIKFWPTSNTRKIVLFITELEDLIVYVKPDDCMAIAKPLALQLARCIRSPQFQVAERALSLWMSKEFCSLMLYCEPVVDILLPVVFRDLFQAADAHWHEGVAALSAHVLSLYMQTAEPAYSRCMGELEAEMGLEAKERLQQLAHAAMEEPFYDNEEGYYEEGGELDPTLSPGPGAWENHGAGAGAGGAGAGSGGMGR